MPEEDFDIDALAKYLHLTPVQVRKMANRDKLPARRVGGDWRFSRAEIHHWLEDKIGVSDDSGLQEVERVLEQQVNSREEIKLAELLSVDRISIPFPARTKNSVIEQLCEFAANSGALWQPKEMADALRRREALHPTALENGVALLHPRRPKPSYFGESFVALGVTSNGIPFGGPRGCLTDIFFLIASADESIHLRVLARLSRLIQNADLCNQLREVTDAASAWQAFDDAEQLI